MSILIKNIEVNGKKKDIFIKKNLIEKISGKIDRAADIKIDGRGKAALPPFINGHTHAAMNLMRGYADDMEVMEWLKKKIWPFETGITEEDVYWGAKFACLEMIKSGTTFFNDMYWYFHGTARAVEEMGMRAMLSAVFIDMFDAKKAREQITANERLLEEAKKYSDRIRFALGPHAIYTVSEESLRWIKNFADKNNLFIHTHLSESEAEVKNCIKKNKMRPVEYLEKIGFLGPNIVAAHSVWLNEKEIKILDKHKIKIAYNPTSNMKLASGVFPYQKIKNKKNICLGTDGSASNNNLDMLEEMKIGSLLQKIGQMNPTALPAAEALAMATDNGAEIFGLNCGQIKEGGLADLILIDLNNLNLNPRHNFISDLVYSANGSSVDAVICDGKILMLNKYVKGEEEIIKKANEAARRLSRNL